MLRLSALCLLLACAPAHAQTRPFDFGSADTPTEGLPGDYGASAARVHTFGGPSYIGVEWRTGLGLEADGAAGPFSLGLSGRLHAGTDGLFEPDTDETYDLLRLVRYARLDPTTRLPVYARVGPLANVTLGPGHLVHGFQTTTAWEERTVGAETVVRMPGVQLAGFADDLRLDGLVGGRLVLSPFERTRPSLLQSLRLGASAVTDLGLDADARTTAFSADLQLAVLRLGDFALSPFASAAWFSEYGSGAGVGAEFASEDLIGLGRLSATVGLFQSGERFIPGYFNPFYSVSNPTARIWDANGFYRDRSVDQTVGTTLAEADGGFSTYFRLRALVFDAFELATFVRRSYGDPVSEGGLRLVVAPGGGDPVRFVFEVQRQGRTSFFSLFSAFRDQNALVFHLDYALTGPARLFIRSRYGYRRVADGPDGSERYLVERRFEPFVGIRLLGR